MVSLEHQTHLQNPIFSLDSLFCEEEHFDQDLGFQDFQEQDVYENFNETPLDDNNNKSISSLLECDLFWEDDELVYLLSKEKQISLNFEDECLMKARKGGIDWVLRVCSHYGFGGLTVVLAVNYFDRFISSFCLQNDNPWMIQLVAVTCLSLAAKVEETQVPLLIDFQVEESKFVFDSKSIQRMELLVLSSLDWKMNPVTQFSFIDHIVRRLGLKMYPHCDFLRRCESIILSAITDSRLLSYLPSVIATAIISVVIKEVDPCNAMDYQAQLMDMLKSSKERVDECYNLIVEVSGDSHLDQYRNHKRKYESVPSSPNGVIDGYFSCDSSNDSWTVASSVMSSPGPLNKKRALDQQMRLVPPNRAATGVLSSTT